MPRVVARPVGSRGDANPPPTSISRGVQPPQAADSTPIVSAKLDAIARQTSTAWWCRPRCAITPATSSSSAASASGPAANRSSVGIPGLYADAASRIGTSVSANSVSVSSPS